MPTGRPIKVRLPVPGGVALLLLLESHPVSHRKIFLQSGTNFLVLPCECFRAGPKEIRREQRSQHRSAGVFACEFPHRPVPEPECVTHQLEKPAAGRRPNRSRDGYATRFLQPQSARGWIPFRGVLPHLKKEGGTYFITFRQAGTLPKEVLLRFKHERDAILQQASAAKRPLTRHEQEELFRWYSSRVDKHLDAGHGDCHLRDPELASLVAGAVSIL